MWMYFRDDSAQDTANHLHSGHIGYGQALGTSVKIVGASCCFHVVCMYVHTDAHDEIILYQVHKTPDSIPKPHTSYP